MPRNFLKLYLLLLLSTFQGIAQQLPSRQYTTAEGLSNNAIRALHLDSRGILWIGTENGVTTLENGVFRNFFESDGLAFNSCWDIIEDKNHNLWFGSYGGGVTFFDGKTFQKIQEIDGLADNRIRHFYPYQDYMLVGTEDGISLVHLETLKVTPIDGTANGTDLNYTAGFWELDGGLFYSTYRSGSYEIFWENNLPKVRKINDWLPIFAVFQEGEKLLLSDKGSLKSVSITDFISGKNPTESQESSVFWQKLNGPNQKTYLLASGLFTKDGGIFQWENGNLSSLSERFDIDSKFIQSGVMDQDRGLLFLGSLDKGLYQVRIDGAVIFEEFGEKEVKGIAGNENILGFLHGQGLEIRNPKTDRITQVKAQQLKDIQAAYYRRFPEKIPEHMDGFFELDPKITAEEMEFYELHFRDSFFWINTNLGVYKIDEAGKILTYLPVHCYSMGFTPEGKLMETNPYAGVRIYDDPDNFSYTYFHPDEPSTPLQISKVVTGKQGTYLASVFHGFYQWDGKEFFSYLKEGIWAEQKFKSLHRLDNGNILVGTEFGELYQITPYPNFKIIRHWDKDELQGTSILAIESFENAIIVITEKGIHLLEDEKNSFLDEEQGFYQKLFLSAKRIGEVLYIGTSKGFYQINLPDFIRNLNQNQKIQLGITELKINHQLVPPDNFNWFVLEVQKLKLEANENTLFIRFKPTGPLDSEKLRYRYRLKSSAEWTEYFTEPILELPYLPWGEYLLEVEVWDYHSGSMSVIPLLDFSIKRPYYLRVWFILLIIICMVSLFVLIYRTRSQQFKAKTLMNQRLTEIKLEALRSQMNPHFTFNAINSIQYFILKNDSKQALNYLGKFSSLIRSTLDQSSKSQITLAEEIDYLSRYIEVENMRMDDRVTWTIEGNALEHKNDIHLSPMLIQPLVENVFVHAFPPDHPEPKLSIRFEIQDPNQLHCIVEDNGVGFPTEQQTTHESKGTKLIREKLMLLPGYSEESLIVETGTWGTKVRVKINF
ncbi:histidine kinase [Algoriphagus sp.]|uniref:sensor histidine kinase n=1 Tax=Algoriphagus sp. TaxID=1872435 RepID=UPI003919FB78